MNSEPSRFIPQHIVKCYCRKPLPCIPAKCIRKISSENPKFIKFLTDSGNPVAPAERITSSIGSSSRSVSKCSNQNSDFTPTLTSTSSSVSSGSSTATNLTARRRMYEQATELAARGQNGATSFYSLPKSNKSAFQNMSDEEIHQLNQFRLQNADKCYSLLSRNSVNNRLRMYDKLPEKHVCEFQYRLNKRGTLEPAHRDRKGRTKCASCGRTTAEAAAGIKVNEDDSTPNAIVPIKILSKHRIILDIPDKNREGKKNACLKNPILPSNSLALKFQKMY